MTNKTTKSALLTSSISLLLCFAMLLGTTFAWFTDSATSAGNRIQAGKLDVKLLMWDGSDYVDISDKTGDIFAEADKAHDSNKTLWEPGKTQVVYLAIENAGNLDLKYNVNIKAYKDDTNTDNEIDMTPAMRYAITPDAQNGTGVTAWTSANAQTVELGMNKTQSEDVKLVKGQKHYFALSVHMLEDAGNEYQNASVLFDLIVDATQLNSEKDSFSTEYDKDATYAVSNVEDLQAAIDGAAEGTTVISLANDITEEFKITQKANTKLIIDGNGNTVSAPITLDGKSATITSAGAVIRNVKFADGSFAEDACIRLGDSTNATRYVCNLTVENCTFDIDGKVGVKSYTGGDKNLKIIGCTATEKAHSLVQAKGIDNVVVENCNVYSKNGMNFNNSVIVKIAGCTVDTKGYAVRFGESSGGTGAAETYLIKDCNLKSANAEGDATIILRGTADNSTLTIQNTTISGTPDIANTATNATVIK